ncbi:DUF4190 domain-containing protein [Streptomyces sp. NA04227]|uniref:DUF4190 domain-containing protein n=1 Tax=Streptomyces sp. NA04227 TaxID=2742136 RepID=UPI0020CA43C5|nr:DUF4190 domain-containing protein [Streptomyces sp. NA04227]
MTTPEPPGPQQPWPGGPAQPGPQDPYAPPAGGHVPPGGYPGAGGPYGGLPYGAPYQPWPGYVPYSKPPVNGLAIASLVLGLFCCVPGLGVVLGAIGLSQISKKGERGKGLAIAGIVTSALGIVLFALMLIGGGWSDFREGLEDDGRDSGKSRGPGEVTFTLEIGECFESQNGSLEGLTYDVDRVSCEDPHDGEIYANFRVPGGVWPGEKELNSTADKKCYALRDSYAADTWALPGYAEVYYFTPTEESWDYGDREISCMFGHTESGRTLNRSLRNDPSELDSDQRAYLKAAKLTVDALESAPPGEYVEDDLAAHKRWAQRMSSALREQERALSAHTWPTKAATAVAGEIHAVSAARREWVKAAAAGDADTFYRHYEAAENLLTDTTRIPARKALGLDISPPEVPEDKPEDQEDAGSSGGSGDSGGSGAAV